MRSQATLPETSTGCSMTARCRSARGDAQGRRNATVERGPRSSSRRPSTSQAEPVRSSITRPAAARAPGTPLRRPCRQRAQPRLDPARSPSDLPGSSGHLAARKVARDVATLVDPPTVKRPQTALSLNAVEARRVMATAQAHRSAAQWTVALAVGLRQSEALGLRWTDVDLDNGTPSVRRGLHRVSGQGQRAVRLTGTGSAPVATTLPPETTQAALRIGGRPGQRGGAEGTRTPDPHTARAAGGGPRTSAAVHRCRSTRDVVPRDSLRTTVNAMVWPPSWHHAEAA